MVTVAHAPSAAERREALKELLTRTRTCERCPELAKTRKTVVFGAGNADAGRCDHAEPGDDGPPSHHNAVNRENTMADWNPPNPLATDSAWSTRRSRAVTGV